MGHLCLRIIFSYCLEMDYLNKSKQECIPVGCVLPAAVAIGSDQQGMLGYTAPGDLQGMLGYHHPPVNRMTDRHV